jgi:hypothetical protein
MTHHENNEDLSPEEKKFRELMTNGDDFVKIEIYRSAISRYKEAAMLGIDNDLANRKIADCEKLLQNERKWIYVVLAVAAVSALLIWLL